MVSAFGAAQSIGPLGGKDGSAWDDGAHSGIRQIKISYKDAIYSISTEYEDANGVFKWSANHGGTGGSSSVTVALDSPNEFLVSVTGFYSDVKGDVVLCSLTFQTNHRVFGPFGTKIGKFFSIPTFGGKIVGFFGSSGGLLNSLGAYVMPSYESFSVGPFGGVGGGVWIDGMFTTVRKVEIEHLQDAITSFQVEYDSNGSSVLGKKHGIVSGGTKYVATIDYSGGEYIVSISGTFGKTVFNHPVLHSLTIETNKKKHGPIGITTGTPFTTGSFGSKIVGFHGRSGDYVDAIGVYTLPLPMPTSYQFLGPVGGEGVPWDDGFYCDVRSIKLTYGDFIDSLQFEYDVFGRSLLSEKHGGGGGSAKEIKLDYPKEYLVSMSGHSDTGAGRYIKSLTFESNKKTYGPFGDQTGNPFKFSITNSKIVGFHGVEGKFIDAVGVYTKPIVD